MPMVLTSPRFRSNAQLQQAAFNAPPLKRGAEGEHVRLVQQALIDLGYAMPVSVKQHGTPDGVYGNETVQKVIAFQVREKLSADGSVGQFTMHKLDEKLPNPGEPMPPLPGADTYIVPGLKVVIAQPTQNTC